jgi:hypothetical protein
MVVIRALPHGTRGEGDRARLGHRPDIGSVLADIGRDYRLAGLKRRTQIRHRRRLRIDQRRVVREAFFDLFGQRRPCRAQAVDLDSQGPNDLGVLLVHRHASVHNTKQHQVRHHLVQQPSKKKT